MNLNVLYNDKLIESQAIKRIERLTNRLLENHSATPDGIFSSSGRAEILGNHTDHNHGKVIVAAIGCDVIAVCKKRQDKIISIHSEGYEEVVVDITNLQKVPHEVGKSHALVRGVAAKICELGYEFNGFTAYTHSTIFKGAGVSSSAAFEVLVCEIINSFYLNNVLTPFEKAQIAQFAENEYFGKPCGILDQSGIALGGFNMLDFADPQKPVIKKLSVPKGYSLVLTNTGGDHAQLTEHYAAIRSEMHAVANFFNKSYLREITLNDILSNLSALKDKVSERAILRAFHFFSENERVSTAAQALQNGQTEVFLQCVTQSGDSSHSLLQNCYVPGSENQPIALAVNATKRVVVDGAVRVHGGGFAGTILAFVKDEQTNTYLEFMKSVFGDENVFATKIREVGTVRIK